MAVIHRFVFVLLVAVGANAQAAPTVLPSSAASSASSKPVDDEPTLKARAAYVEGLQLVQKQQWGEALGAFERSLAIRTHALTIYNVGVCERNLGRYTRARRTLREALARHASTGSTELPTSYLEEAHAFLVEIEGLLIRLTVTVKPIDAALQVDGRPLAADTDGVTMVAGLEAPGPGKPPAKATFTLLADAGAHVFTLTRQGFQTVSVQKTFSTGTKATLDLVADKLPAIIRVRSDRGGSVVSIGGVDVGIAPVEVIRPAGKYDVLVNRAGYVPYRVSVDARPGEQFDLAATLPPETVPLTKKWWFWTVAGVAVTGAAVGTYYLTRPAPERPAPDGGGLGWVVSTP